MKTNIWKWISITLIAIILCYGAYKGYSCGRVKLEEHIDAMVDVRVAQELEHVQSQLSEKENDIWKASKCAFVEGYYAQKMGMDSPVSADYFLTKYKSIEKYLPSTGIDIEAIIARMNEDNLDLVKTYMDAHGID